MTPFPNQRLLSHVAKRASLRPEFLGWVLTRYATQENLSEDDLTKLLGITTLDLSKIALCLRPRQEYFAADVKQIASKFNTDPATLASIIRLVESVEAMATSREEMPSVPGLLIAARAREKKSDKPRDKENHNDNSS